jgi:ABC-2 type transport system permease protein
MSLAGFNQLVKRDLVRMGRQPARIVASVGTPALLGLFLASGFSEGLSPGGGSYGAYLLPGMVVMVVLFSSIFSAISLIDDREKGVLQGIIVSPMRWRAIALARLTGASIVAGLQALVLVGIGLATGSAQVTTHLPFALVAIALVSVGTTGIGLALAWIINSKEGFHGVMNLVLMPMWLLSGSFFGRDSATGWLDLVMIINPLTHATDALRWSLGGPGEITVWTWVIAGAFALGGTLLTTEAIGRPPKPGSM